MQQVAAVRKYAQLFDPERLRVRLRRGFGYPGRCTPGLLALRQMYEQAMHKEPSMRQTRV